MAEQEQRFHLTSEEVVELKPKMTAHERLVGVVTGSYDLSAEQFRARTDEELRDLKRKGLSGVDLFGFRNTRLLLRDQIGSVLDRLDNRERKALELNFGLADGRNRNNTEIAQELVVSERTVRRIKARALAKLRTESNKSELKSYLV